MSRQTVKKHKIQFLHGLRLRTGAMLLFTAAGGLFTIAGPKILGMVTTELFQGIMAKLNGTGGMNPEAIAHMLKILLFFYVVSMLLLTAAQWMQVSLRTGLAKQLRSQVYCKLQVLPLCWYETHSAGEVLSTLMEDTEVYADGSFAAMAGRTMAAVTLTGTAVMLYTIEPVLPLAAFIIVAVSFVMLHGMKRVMHKCEITKQMQQQNACQMIEEVYSGRADIQAFEREQSSAEAFYKWNSGWGRALGRQQFLEDVLVQLMQLTGNAGYILALAVGGFFAAQGRMQIGDIQAFLHYIRNLIQPVSDLANARSQSGKAQAAGERLQAFLQEAEETDWMEQEHAAQQRIHGNVEPPVSEPGHGAGEVCFQHVDFGYQPGQYVIRDFNLQVKSGQRIAIVGVTGAGKTTLIKLMMRFYPVWAGEIWIDGRNIKEYEASELRSRFGAVLQDTWLFEGTVLENLRYGGQASEQEVMQAAGKAQADDFIGRLPQGYETVISESTELLSAGQKQLLAIARAFLADPEILLLDEATSSVDAQTEKQVHEAMEQLMRNRTSFIIAHRQSSIRTADQVIRIQEQKQ